MIKLTDKFKSNGKEVGYNWYGWKELNFWYWISTNTINSSHRWYKRRSFRLQIFKGYFLAYDWEQHWWNPLAFEVGISAKYNDQVQIRHYSQMCRWTHKVKWPLI